MMNGTTMTAVMKVTIMIASTWLLTMLRTLNHAHTSSLVLNAGLPLLPMVKKSLDPAMK